VPPSTVRVAAFAWFLTAGFAGLWLASRTSWWLLLVGFTAILAGWFYTGGPRPYGYYGFGELFVMIYFGFVATGGRQLRPAPGGSGVVMVVWSGYRSDGLRPVGGEQPS